MNSKYYVYNRDAWKRIMEHNYYDDIGPATIEVANGLILPARYVSGGVSAGGCCDENFNFVAGLCRETGHNRYGDVNMGYTVPDNQITMCDFSVVFGGVLISHFGHMLIDNLTRLWWHVLNKNSEIKIAFITTMGGVKPWMYDFFDLLEINRDRILIVDKPTRFNRVIVPYQAIQSWDKFKNMSLLPYDLMVKNALCKTKIQNFPAKVYYTKRYYNEGDNVTLNEEYFERYYKGKGYEIIAPEQHSLEDQIAYAYNAEYFASTLGSVEHFVIFSKPQTNVDILTRTKSDVLSVVGVIAQMRDLNCTIIDGSRNYLYCDRTMGVSLLGSNEFWSKFVLERWGDVINKDEAFNKDLSVEYLCEWLKILVEKPKVFNWLKLGNVSFFDFFSRLSELLIGQKPDPDKYIFNGEKK